ncbi:MAG TPA: 4-hydroxy-tetrahydrodipicolinate reductase [Fimbriimonadaceae bacterium]|nr:4-hydroxy-tetrahydrodipicolinate reductase [Fimbriimonadaceae bacterium]
MSIRVAVCGALGRMGKESVRAIQGAKDLELVAQIDQEPFTEGVLSCYASLAEAIEATRPDVCVEFTHPTSAVNNALTCLERGVAVVIGTSGLGESEQAQVRESALAHKTPALLVPNFAIGAVLMMRFAEQAARWMPEATIVELHHPDKADAPSGTARHTAHRIAAARPDFTPRAVRDDLVVQGALGADTEGVPVHSVRLSGFVAHQEVIFGGPGETLTIRHDSLDRSSFMPGVLLAVREVRSRPGLTVGLEALMFN